MILFRRVRRFFSDKPWKDVTTRKLAFVYCLIMGSAVISFGAVMIVMNKFDSATWMSESLSFLKWMLTTGVVIVLTNNTNEVIKFLKNKQDDN